MIDILTEGTGRYRRNTIIVAFVLLLIFLFALVDLFVPTALAEWAMILTVWRITGLAFGTGIT